MRRKQFNIMIVGQAGRLQYEALVFLASLREVAPEFKGGIYLAEPEPGPLWEETDPRIHDQEFLDLLDEFGVKRVSFESRYFGKSYPYGNKIEALFALPKGKPFVFFDTDTLILSDPSQTPFDFNKPTASLRREASWPIVELYGPKLHDIWRSVYALCGQDVEEALDPSQPEGYWQRYPYYNAGYFYYSCPHKFGARFLEYALAIRDQTPPELVIQSLDPWLDQIALPVVIHSFGGGPNVLEPGWLDGKISCHYRAVPLLYARESDAVIEHFEKVTSPNKIKKILKRHEPFLRLLYQKRGTKVRALFDQDNLPKRERAIRNRIKSNNLWMR